MLNRQFSYLLALLLPLLHSCSDHSSSQQAQGGNQYSEQEDANNEPLSLQNRLSIIFDMMRIYGLSLNK